MAYRVYMSDLLSAHLSVISGNDADIPRYYDIVHLGEKRHNESTDEIIARFAPLRRKE